jgi:hypothetical protein
LIDTNKDLWVWLFKDRKFGFAGVSIKMYEAETGKLFSQQKDLQLELAGWMIYMLF